MNTYDTDAPRLGWHWLWFAPLCVVVLVFVEGHTVPYAFRLLKLAIARWLWVGLLSPSAYFCFCMLIASVYLPFQGLLFTAGFVTAEGGVARRRFHGILIVVAIFLLPVVTDFLTWGSFPFPVDSNGTGHLRIIPFIPWPSGHIGEY